MNRKFPAVAMVTVSCLMAACTTTGLLTSTRDLRHNENPAEVLDLGIYALPQILHTVSVKFPACTVADAKSNTCPSAELSLDDTPTVLPDPRHVYRLRSRMSAYSDATLIVQTDGKQLLTSVSATAKDQSGAIAAQLAELVKAGARATTAFGVFSSARSTAIAKVIEASQSAKVDASGYPEVTLTATLDFGADGVAERTAFAKSLEGPARRYGRGTQVNLQVTPPEAVTGRNISSSAQTSGNECSIGVCYRPVLPYRVKLIGTTGGSVAWATSSLIALLPNDAPLLSIDLHSTKFVERTGTLTFASGVLTKVDIAKPSEALAAITLPVTILNTLASIPAELLTLRISLTTQQTELLTKQAALAKAIADAKKTSASQ